MKLLDLNLLVYAANTESPHHERAKAWLDNALSGDETIALAWVVVLGFLRLTTHARVMTKPLSPELAVQVIAAWLDRPQVILLAPGERHWSVLRSLLITAGTAGNLTTDAHLAALAIEHNAELCSADGDFARFTGLRWTNPLAG